MSRNEGLTKRPKVYFLMRTSATVLLPRDMSRRSVFEPEIIEQQVECKYTLCMSVAILILLEANKESCEIVSFKMIQSVLKYLFEDKLSQN